MGRTHFSWLLSAAIALASVSGCSFGKDDAAPEMNTCQVNADCTTQHCDSGRCVAEVQTPMQVTVIVTPKRAPDGSQAQAIVADAFALAGGPQTIDLRLPVSVPVHVRSKNKAIGAQASFIPIDTKNRFTSKTSKLTVLPADQDGVEPANNTMLLEGMDYRVLIQPSEASLPAHSQLFTAQADASVDVDYDKLEAKTRRFTIRNAALVGFQVRAVSEVTGAPISNTAKFSGSLTGLSAVSLKFDDADAAYRLEFTPADQKAYSTAAAGSCGDDAPQPKISVPSRLITPDLTGTEKWYVQLPDLYPAIEYSGVIGLCSAQKLTAPLQVSLTTEDLYLASGNDSELIQGSYETAAAATWDPEENKFRFCARVPPGTYTVKVTPSPSLNCEIFAERRVLRPSRLATDEDQLDLRMPAMLTANVLTPERMPMPKATVDVLALTAAGDVMLAPDDRSVANYNRSGSISTGTDGSFTLSVDRGRYDVFIKPPEASNYAWRVIYDVAVAATNAEFATEIMLSEPVAVTGQLQYINGSNRDQQSLVDAEVHAYTLVNVDGQGEQRSVEIGSGHANGSGRVTLLLPPSLQHSWNP